MSRRLAFGAALGILAAATIMSGTPVGSTGSRPTDTISVGARDGNHHGQSGTVWVVNRDKGEITIFDARSGRPLATAPTGAGAHEVAISNDVDKAYITNENENTVSIVSTRTLAGRTIPLGPRPHHAEPSRDGETILVGLVGTNVVAAIDAETGQVSTYTSSSNPAATAHGPFLRDETIYVAHETGDEVTGIDADDRGHRVHRRWDLAADRGACRSARATAVRLGTGRGQGQSDRSGHARHRRRGGRRRPAGDDAAHARPPHTDREHARHAGPAGLRRHQEPHPHRHDRPRRIRDVR